MPGLWTQLIGAGASEASRAVSVDPGMDVDSEGECLSSLLPSVHTAPVSKLILILHVANRHAQCDIVLHCLNKLLFQAVAKKYHVYYCSFCHVYQVTWTTRSHSQHLSAACVSIYLEFCPYMTVLTLLLGFCPGVPPMVPTMVKLPGQSRSMIQLLPPPADLDNPLTAVDIARSAEVNKLQTLSQPVLLATICRHLCCDNLPQLLLPSLLGLSSHHCSISGYVQAVCTCTHASVDSCLMYSLLLSHLCIVDADFVRCVLTCAGVAAGPARQCQSQSSGCRWLEQPGSASLDGPAHLASAGARRAQRLPQGQVSCQEEGSSGSGQPGTAFSLLLHCDVK